MVVAVALVGLIGAAVLIGTRPSDRVQLRATAAALAVFIEETRLNAALHGHGIALRYSERAHSFQAGPRVLSLPEAVSVQTPGGAPIEVDIRPSGESKGAVIVLNRGVAQVSLRLDWLTGAVRVSG